MRSSLALAFLVCSVTLSASAQDGADGEASVTTGGTLRVHIVSLRSDDGYVGCLLYRGAEGFPGEAEHAVQKIAGVYGRTNRRTATCTFDDVPAGRYAVAVGHDENGNRRMDKNLMGIPIEGWGTSRDAPARFGPPSYTDAVFRFNGRRQLITVTMRYGF
jgi:uncharacterized protein (DUF2141 family)